MSFESRSTYECLTPVISEFTQIKQLILQPFPQYDKIDESVSSVTEFELSSQKLLNTSPIKKQRNLRVLKLIDVQLCDVAFVGSLTCLTQLDLIRNNISDIFALSKLANLLQLNISHNRISDLSPLASCAKLVWLFAQDNCVLDVSPLEHLACLDTLWIYNNNITTFTPVKNHNCFNQYRIGNQSVPTQKQLFCRERAVRILQQNKKQNIIDNQSKKIKQALRSIQNGLQIIMEKYMEQMVHQTQLFVEILEAENEVWQ
ncbi:Chain_A [Hexamita inflata]|uniref:Rab Family Protein n=1 Tax=Hexamita inflata TaxID=28002 RepID=A0AA86TUU5_9EUKA|nr:Chain A [Hexamita inflata]